MDTTSSAVARLLQLLAEHPDVQNRLRNEIMEAQEGRGELDYNDLTTMPYLDAVCRETLRLFVYSPCSPPPRTDYSSQIPTVHVCNADVSIFRGVECCYLLTSHIYSEGHSSPASSLSRRPLRGSTAQTSTRFSFPRTRVSTCRSERPTAIL
jgi:hypothetical protein